MDEIELDPRIRSFYDQGREDGRLSRVDNPSGPLEFVRTQELIERHLPPGHLEILDVGGGPGAYSAWLTQLGHHVEVIDPVPLHVKQASAKGLMAELGDARAIARADSSVDVVLLLGPLYHLVERRDRVKALVEARRILRPGGTIFAAAISRFAALMDLLVRLDRLHNTAVFEDVVECLATGVFGSPRSGLFTTSYAHRPSELIDEAREAGLGTSALYNVEGPGFLVTNFEDRWNDPLRRDALLDAARLIEDDPDLLAAASHLMLVSG